MAFLIDGHFAHSALAKRKPVDAQRLAQARSLVLHRLRETETESDVEAERQSLELIYNCALRAVYNTHRTARGVPAADLIIERLLDEVAVLLVHCRQMQRPQP